jgi:hypothetical protein
MAFVRPAGLSSSNRRLGASPRICASPRAAPGRAHRAAFARRSRVTLRCRDDVGRFGDTLCGSRGGMRRQGAAAATQPLSRSGSQRVRPADALELSAGHIDGRRGMSATAAHRSARALHGRLRGHRNLHPGCPDVRMHHRAEWPGMVVHALTPQRFGSVEPSALCQRAVGGAAELSPAVRSMPGPAITLCEAV